MFCEKCGTKLPSDSAFCINCGTSINPPSNSQEKIIDNEVILNVKPTFKLGYIMLSELSFIALLLVIFFAPVIAITLLTSNSYSIFGPLLGFFVFIIAICIVWTAFRKAQYDNYSYDFYKTKVTYKDGFLNKSEKEVKYKHIREISKRESIFQRLFGLGSIILYTNAETGYGNGIYILNVTDVDNIYKQIKEIIDI